MSILFGICLDRGTDVREQDLRNLGGATERYALDGTFVRTYGRIGMGFQPYHTHERSHLEAHPWVSQRGDMVSIDGRLDNHHELAELLGLTASASDSEIVLSAFERWEDSCFSRFIGDWAIALWSSAEEALYLARDHAGSRTLYYEREGERILWGTFLETFFLEKRVRTLDATYLARYLAALPTGDLTPYSGISAVTPSHFLRFGKKRTEKRMHWSWLVHDQVRYANDHEYEDHFLDLFQRSVERRTGPGAPILAQLSGGMDSSAIVCVSDWLRGQRGACSLLDTVSYYDDREPNWNERPYFETVEKRRGKKGLHLPWPLLGEAIEPAPEMYFWPGADTALYENERRLAELTSGRNYRVILSGIGGDELLGGFPTGIPALADLLIVGNLRGFAKSALEWCLVDQTPFLSMTTRTFRFLAQQYWPLGTGRRDVPAWATGKLFMQLRRQQASLPGRWSFSRPSCIAAARMVPVLLETMPHRRPYHFVRYEFRYPYLDRDLVDFLLRVPRERLLRPGRRRAMMRSALRSVVPTEIIERRRKAARSRSLLLTLRRQEGKIRALFSELPGPLAELVDPEILRKSAVAAIYKSDLAIAQGIVRAIFLAFWCKSYESRQE
ncbi:MAG: hypothetical protein JF563_00995, partial [Acidobacteriales bacterium]|nr:hypothetical protein [Terriglobales bacterium]